MTAPQPAISAIVPAFRAAHLLPRVLAPLIALRDAGEISEVIVIDDVSPDDTAEVAERLGAQVIRSTRNGGPGAARNLGARAATGDLLWMVDSDVIPEADGPRHIRAAFAEPGVRAVFGSYDELPDGAPWFSRYKNLTHRYYHQLARREASTFWAGCGAVDREFYLSIGGFDAETYRVPSIEDIELGYRIRRHGGRILLIREFEAKHLKVWTIPNAIHTDIFRRALPWARLMISQEGVPDDLNTSWGERVKALVALVLVLALLATPLAAEAGLLALAAAALALALNRDFARYLYGHGGLGIAVGGLIYHQFYYIYSATVFVWCLFEYHVLRRRELRTIS
ncbi:MAG: glycosyltransferase [Novosphingobium sp.]